MADEQIVDTNDQTDSTTADQKAGTGTTDQQTRTQTSTREPAPARNADEDARNRGILADLQKERRARQDGEVRYREMEARLAQETRRIQALVGVNPRSAQETEMDEIRERIHQVMPHLKDITAEDLKALRELREQSGSLQEATMHHYKLHGRRMLDQVGESVAKELGGKLSTRQQNRLERAYTAEAEANPDFLARHDAGDPTLIAEFVKEWIDDFIEPARRKVTQQEVDRSRRVPSGKDRSLVTQGAKKINVNDPAAVEDMLVAGFRERGGQFGRR